VAGFSPEEISGQDLRSAVGRTLGWQFIKSAAFELERVGNTYHFEGHGSGHGVGLCVIGSVNLAVAGRTSTEILNKYFPGLEVGPPLALSSGVPVVTRSTSVPPSAPIAVPSANRAPSPAVAAPSPISLGLPDDEEGERERISLLADFARTDIARALNVTAPPRVVIRFHPTTASYERATGQPWFTSGALVGGELHLLPVAVLRERGVLERTIRHELVHVMADPVLRDRPVWVREGAAIYFAGGRPGDPGLAVYRQSRLSCPSDGVLLRPVSAGALSNALAGALSCFARQVEVGKRWRDVR
jgi:hypothetical protein